MRLPHLDQRVPLHRGEAGQLATAIEWVLTQQLAQRLSSQMALCLVPLTRVGSRLLARARQEQYHVGRRPAKPRPMALRYDELVALMHILPQAPAAGLAWGEVQRASLNLARFIDFADAA